MSKVLSSARHFIATNARLLERLRFGVAFDGLACDHVARAVVAYQRADGGLGYALEPDSRAETSQPLFVEVGLVALQEVAWRDRDLANQFCSYLATVCAHDGLVAPLLADASRYAHASHWSDPQEASLNLTISLCGLLNYQGATHPWLARATDECVRRLFERPPTEAHTLLCASRLAEHASDRALSTKIIDLISSALPSASYFRSDPASTDYGLTPLHFARSPNSPMAQVFARDHVDEYLEQLRATQRSDGSWPVPWQPPGQAAAAEWAGIVTLEAVRTLSAYGALD
jgi:hypothetical protein